LSAMAPTRFATAPGPSVGRSLELRVPGQIRRLTDSRKRRAEQPRRNPAWTLPGVSTRPDRQHRHVANYHESPAQRARTVSGRCRAQAVTRGQAHPRRGGRGRAGLLDGDRATGESYTVAHHLFGAEDDRRAMLAYLRYLDSYAKVDRHWLFAERNLV
jgi:SnoaL-like domain